MNWYKKAKKFNKEELEKQGYNFDITDYGNEGFSISAYFDGKQIGYAGFTTDPKITGFDDLDSIGKNEMWIVNLEVQKEHQRKGIASTLYEIAEQVSGKTIVRTPARTPDSDALWQQKNRNFGYKKSLI